MLSEWLRNGVYVVAVSRCAVSSIIAAALLAACGASQNGGPGALPVGTVPGQAKAHSWVRQGAKNEGLVYAEGNGCGGVCILSYPQGRLVGSIALSGNVGGDCSDSQGNVFITNDTQVLEFAHGGITPIATLTLPGINAAACGVDAITGNLAVVFGGGSAGNIAIFANATGSPTLYASGISPYYCGYDNAGNLFVSGYHSYYPGYPQFAELPHGSADFLQLSISKSVDGPGQVQWDGSYITLEGRQPHHIKISRLSISGSAATVVSVTQLRGPRFAHQTWIVGNRVIVPYSTQGSNSNKIGLWRYPKSGKVVVKFGDFGQNGFTQILGVTLSVAPSGSLRPQ